MAKDTTEVAAVVVADPSISRSSVTDYPEPKNSVSEPKNTREITQNRPRYVCVLK